MKKSCFAYAFVAVLVSFAFPEKYGIYSDYLNRPTNRKIYDRVVELVNEEGEKNGVSCHKASSTKAPCIVVNEDKSITVKFSDGEVITQNEYFNPVRKNYVDSDGFLRDCNNTPEYYAHGILRIINSRKTENAKSVDPVLVDSFIPANFYGHEVETDKNEKVSLAVLNDGSLFIKEGKSFYVFDSQIMFKNDVLKLLGHYEKNAGKKWVLSSTDGDHLKAFNDMSKTIYTLSPSGAPKKRELIEGLRSVDYNEIGLSKNGIPVFSKHISKEHEEPAFNSDDSKKNRKIKIDDFYNIALIENEELKEFPQIKSLNSNKYSWLVGNGDDIWIRTVNSAVYGDKDNSIYIYSPDAKLLKVLREPFIDHFTLMDQYGFSIKSGVLFESNLVHVCDDSSFIVKNEFKRDNEIVGCVFICYSQYGKEKWRLQPPKGTFNFDFAEYRNGILYFIDQDTKTVFRYVDDVSSLDKTFLAISSASNKLSVNPKDYNQYLELAYNYELIGSKWLSFENYKKYLYYCPMNPVAKEKCLMAEVELQKIIAKEYASVVYELLEEYGEESARDDYTRAMKILEKLRKQVPWDMEVQSLYGELRSAYNSDYSSTKQKLPELRVAEVNIYPIFPVLMNVYSQNSSGVIRVVNTSQDEIRNITVKSYIRKYMDFPTEGSTIAKLPVGGTKVMDLNTHFNNSILNIDEDTNVQVQITVEWEQRGARQNVTVTRPVTIYKNSAMSWKDTAMLSCFILPNDKTVSSFTYSVLDYSEKENSKILSKNFYRALTISNSLGSLPMNYVPDPINPTTDLIGNEYAVDTVRFPQKTLSLKGGDCDDMTTLYCSLLESAGIKSALITTPGHIFAAFDTGLKMNEIYRGLNGYKVIDVEGKVWIPVEVTCLKNGFDYAWRKASEEISVGIEEFILLSDARSKYPPVTMGDETGINVKINETKLKEFNRKTIDGLNETILSILNKYDACKDVGILNSMARIYHSLGEDDVAIDILIRAVRIDKKDRRVQKNLVALCKYKNCMEKLDSVPFSLAAENPQSSDEFSVEDTKERAIDLDVFDFEE